MTASEKIDTPPNLEGSLTDEKSTDVDSNQAQAVFIKPEPEKELVTWEAPARPFKRRNKEFYVTLIGIASLISLILFFVEGWLPVVLIVSIVFLFYVMSTVEPEKIVYKITTKGITILDKKNDWRGMKRFWFTGRYDSELLVIETFYLPGRIELVVSPEMKEKIKKALADYLIYEEAPASFLDKSASWLSRKLPQS